MIITCTFQCKTVHSVNALGHPSLHVSCCQRLQAWARILPRCSVEHNCWGHNRARPTASFLLWAAPTLLIVLSTFEDSVKKHPFFLQIANGKTNFSKINKKCIEIEICSSGRSPERTPSTKSISQSWQNMGCPSSLQHFAVDQRKQLKVRNKKKRDKIKNKFLPQNYFCLWEKKTNIKKLRNKIQNKLHPPTCHKQFCVQEKIRKIKEAFMSKWKHPILIIDLLWMLIK